MRSVLNPELPEQPRQPGADQGRGARGLDRQRGVAAAVHGPPRGGHVPAQRAAEGAGPDPPEQAMAEGSGAVWTMQVSGNHDDGRPFITAMFTYAGGVGARASKPGLSACSYPTGVAAVPIEVVEASAPIRFLRKELRPGSGGAGAQIGGLGQTIEFTVDTDRAVAAQRRHVAARATRRRASSAARPARPARSRVNGEPVTHAGARHAAARRRRAPRPARRRRLRRRRDGSDDSWRASTDMSRGRRRRDRRSPGCGGTSVAARARRAVPACSSGPTAQVRRVDVRRVRRRRRRGPPTLLRDHGVAAGQRGAPGADQLAGVRRRVAGRRAASVRGSCPVDPMGTARRAARAHRAARDPSSGSAPSTAPTRYRAGGEPASTMPT